METFFCVLIVALLIIVCFLVMALQFVLHVLRIVSSHTNRVQIEYVGGYLN
jgi:hypothetical protein